MVDIAREERVEKWDILIHELSDFHNSPDADVVYLGNAVLKADVEKLYFKSKFITNIQLFLCKY